MNGKILMFSKVSLKSFVYDLIDVFMFPNEDTRKRYDKYQVQKCYLNQNLTDTDIASVFFYLSFGLFSWRKKIKRYNFLKWW